MKLAGRHGRHARLRLVFDAGESGVLGRLLEELDAVLAGTGGAAAQDPVLRRLYPSAYPDDEGAAREYRDLTEAGLRSDRIDRLAACRAELVGGVVDLGDPDTARRWLQVLNDLRLAIGTRLGVTQDDDGTEPDDGAETDGDPDTDTDGDTSAVGDPRRQARLVYHWLGYVQDSVVTALMR